MITVVLHTLLEKDRNPDRSKSLYIKHTHTLMAANSYCSQNNLYCYSSIYWSCSSFHHSFMMNLNYAIWWILSTRMKPVMAASSYFKHTRLKKRFSVNWFFGILEVLREPSISVLNFMQNRISRLMSPLSKDKTTLKKRSFAEPFEKVL
jgi:hypothetical protein